jgi:hypothetical protein
MLRRFFFPVPKLEPPVAAIEAPPNNTAEHRLHALEEKVAALQSAISEILQKASVSTQQMPEARQQPVTVEVCVEPIPPEEAQIDNA